MILLLVVGRVKMRAKVRAKHNKAIDENRSDGPGKHE